MAYKSIENESRTMEQIREHYEIEKELASKLRNASKQERHHLYSELYNELYRRVPLHPQLTRKASPDEKNEDVYSQMKFLRQFLSKEIKFLEIGPGDCALTVEVTRYVKQVYAVDVSDEITKDLTKPQNLQLVLCDGSSIPVPPDSIDLAYSNQLMEHLHPDDAFEQLVNIYNALTPGGSYICITPNRLSGPHDVSKNFDEVATGFHLREYTVKDLSRIFSQVGFLQIKAYVGFNGKYIGLPVLPIILYEKLLNSLPEKLKKIVTRNRIVRVLLRIRLVGIKPVGNSKN